MHIAIFFDTRALEIIRLVIDFNSNNAIMVFLGHSEKPAQQVAEVVCKIGIYTPYQCIFREIPIKTERHLPKKKISEGINTVFIRQFIRIDHIAEGLGHLFPIDSPPAMGKNVFRKGEAQCHENCRPVHSMSSKNVFSYQMVGSRPPDAFTPLLIPLADGKTGRFWNKVLRCRKIIHKGIKPDIRNEVFIKKE